jgi:hypothetical protein
MSRKVLRGASFDTSDQLCEAIKKYIDFYNQSAEPFIWKKREVIIRAAHFYYACGLGEKPPPTGKAAAACQNPQKGI